LYFNPLLRGRTNAEMRQPPRHPNPLMTANENAMRQYNLRSRRPNSQTNNHYEEQKGESLERSSNFQETQ
jgi:hypothetical protein